MRTEQIIDGVIDRYSIYTEFHASGNPRGTIILVNGALGTTTVFAQTIKYLIESFNVVAYDLPFAGRSKQHNQLEALITEEEEVRILLDLISRFRCSHILSVSWGSVAALLALARRPVGIKGAVIISFSPVVNEPFRRYMSELRVLLKTPEGRTRLGDVVNDSVGRYLPRLIRNSNFRHIGTLTDHEYAQIDLYIDQVVMMDTKGYVERCATIEVPILFLNGELDDYAKADDSRTMTAYVPTAHFAVVEGAGHFLDLESREARARTQAAIMGFLNGNADMAPFPGETPCPDVAIPSLRVEGRYEAPAAF